MVVTNIQFVVVAFTITVYVLMLAFDSSKRLYHETCRQFLLTITPCYLLLARRVRSGATAKHAAHVCLFPSPVAVLTSYSLGPGNMSGSVVSTVS